MARHCTAARRRRGRRRRADSTFLRPPEDGDEPPPAFRPCQHLLQLLGAGRRVLDLEYERDIATGEAWGRLCRFLDIARLEPRWLRLRKASPLPAEYVEDYDELASALPRLVAEASAEVADRLERRHAADPPASALAARIRDHLGALGGR